MTKISYFQRYSQRENHVTNNTMLMLRHVYQKSPRLLEAVLTGLLDDEEIAIGPRFDQQVGGAHSVPDALILQNPLNIYIEAKRGDWLRDSQIEGHLNSVEASDHPAGSAWLIGLTTNPVEADDAGRWEDMARSRGITFASATYSDLITALERAIGDDPDLGVILDDYKSFIGAEGLLPDQYRKIVAMLCGTSWKENLRHGVYFEPASRNPKWAQARFLGIYHSKKVSHIGRIVASAICWKADGKLVVDRVEFGELNSEIKTRIAAIIEAADYFTGLGDIAHRYYVVDCFEEAGVRKVSPGGMMGHRYLDIVDLGGSEPAPDASSADVVAIVAGRTFT